MTYFKKYLKYKTKYLNLKQNGGTVALLENKPINFDKVEPFAHDRIGCYSLIHNTKWWNELSDELDVNINILCLSEDICPTTLHSTDKIKRFEDNTYELKEGINLLLSCNTKDVANTINKENYLKGITNKPLIGFYSNVHIINNIIIMPKTTKTTLELLTTSINQEILDSHKNKVLKKLIDNKDDWVYLSADTIKERFRHIKQKIVDNVKLEKSKSRFELRDFTEFSGSTITELENYDESGINYIIKEFEERKELERKEELERIREKEIRKTNFINFINELTLDQLNELISSINEDYLLNPTNEEEFKNLLKSILSYETELNLDNFITQISSKFYITNTDEEAGTDEEDDPYGDTEDDSYGDDAYGDDDVDITSFVIKKT